MSQSFRSTNAFNRSNRGRDQIEEALDAIRNVHEDFWLKQGVTPDYEKDELKLANLVDSNQFGIWLWLRHYILKDREAEQLANQPPYDILKEEAELHLSWYTLAEQAVKSDYLPTIFHSPGEEAKDPLYWLVAAAKDYFAKKMHGSGLLRPLGTPAKPVGKVKQYNWALSISKSIEDSTREDLIYKQTEVGALEGLYHLAFALEHLDDRFSRGDYLREAMQTYKCFFRKQRDGKAKPVFIDEQKNLVYLNRGKDTRGFRPTKQQKRQRQKH